MCIRDRAKTREFETDNYVLQSDFNTAFSLLGMRHEVVTGACLLYTSDAADERSSVDLGGRRIIKKKTTDTTGRQSTHHESWTTKNNDKITE